MKEYNDAELNELINAGKQATRELSFLKFKSEMPRIKKLRQYRRDRFELIRKRAIQLNLTEGDLNEIFTYVQV